MQTADTIPPASPPADVSALRRHFEISLYLLLLTGVLTLVSTGKLDLPSILLPPVALLVKGYRWWRRRGPELSHRVATVLTAAYFLFFPVDLWVVSRTLSADAQNQSLYAALLATIHLMLFAIIVRLYSACSLRDYLFLSLMAFTSMLAAAILTVDTVFFVFFFLFLALAISTFVGLEMWRSAQGAVAQPLASGSRAAHRLHHRSGSSRRRCPDFSDPSAGQCRLLVRIQPAADTDFRVQRQCRTWGDRRNQEKQRPRDAHSR